MMKKLGITVIALSLATIAGVDVYTMKQRSNESICRDAFLLADETDVVPLDYSSKDDTWDEIEQPYIDQMTEHRLADKGSELTWEEKIDARVDGGKLARDQHPKEYKKYRQLLDERRSYALDRVVAKCVMKRVML